MPMFFPAAANALPTTGGTMDGDLNMQAADITFLDNDKVIFGTGGDAAIYYDGADLIVDAAIVGGGMMIVLTATTFAGAITMNNGALLKDDDNISFGDVADAQIRWATATAQTTHFLAVLADSTNKNVVISNKSNFNQDHGLAAQSNNTLWIFSATDPELTGTEWMSFTHDGTTGIINSGKGSVKITTDLETTGRLLIPGCFGQMTTTNNVTATTIDGANEVHGATVFVNDAANNSNTTFQAGESNAITVVADATGGDIIVTAANTLSAGDIAIITGTTSYNSPYVVVSATASDFNVTAGFAGTETGTYTRPDNFTVADIGVYDLDYHFSALSASANQDFTFHVYVNATEEDSTHAERRFATTSDKGAIGARGFATLAANDIVWFSVTNETSAGDITITDGTVKLMRFAGTT